MPGYREITIPGERRPTVPARRRVPARDWRTRVGGALAGTAALCRRSPGSVLGSLAALGAAGFICFNALGHQSGRHPAPILPKLAAGGGDARAASSKPAPPKASLAAEAAPPGDALRPEARAAAPAAGGKAARDPIGEIIRSEDTTASVTPRTPVAKADTPVMRAQRALSRLGYAVRPDGAMGPGTRAAIETFERKSGLPVTGEAAGRTLKALASKAGQG